MNRINAPHRLTDLITKAHVDSRGTYGARRVHAELTLGQGVRVSHNAVEMLMRRAGLQGLPNKRRHRSKVQVATATDLVERAFTRSEPDQLWVTDITEHRTREGKVYSRSCWMCSRAAWSAGRSTRLRPQPW